MAKVFVVGATGETGLRLCRQLVEAGHSAIGLHRRPEQAEVLRGIGAIPVMGDLVTTSTTELSELMLEADTVVFTAGANGGGSEMTDAVDGAGVTKASDAAAYAGVWRFLLVSAFPDAWREKRMPEDFEHYMFVKRQADVYLSHTELDWVILRPGTLLNELGTGLIRTGLAIPYGEVSRDDVAATLVQLIETPSVNRLIIELTAGDTPVSEAVAKMAQ
ncbi:SDR family oxidoreductase [Pseudomonas lactis]|uniref:SDR family oxidoreductase n=1 Tax=Pseudomonas lactis TaxID=1615674 RepID=UPI00345C6BD8